MILSPTACYYCVAVHTASSVSMSDFPPLSPTSSQPTAQSPLHPRPLRIFAPEPSINRRFSSFPALSPLPSTADQPVTSPLLSTDEGLSSWPLTLPPQLTQRSEFMPEWVTRVLSPSISESHQPPSMSPSLSTADYPSLLPQLSDEAASTWTIVTTASLSASIPRSHASSAPAGMSSFAALNLLATALPLVRTTSSSTLASSSDSSSPSSSSPSAATSYTLSALTPRRYQRLTGLSLEQRIKRRRQSHQKLDAVRRHREAVAISRLEQLTASRTGTHSLPQSQSHADRHFAKSGTAEEKQLESSIESDKKGKRHRITVLENAVEQLEELQHLVHHLTATCTQQSHDNATLRLQLHSTGWQPCPIAATQATHALSLLSASTVRRVVAEFGAVSLYSALFVSPSVGLLLVDCGSGVVLDVNERLLSGGRCTREDIIGRLVAPTYHVIATLGDWESHPAGVPTSRLQVRGQPAQVCSQYGATKDSVLALYRGQFDQIHVVWRAQLGDGLVYELPLTSFVASKDVVEGGSRPRTVLVALSLSEARRI